MKVLHYSQKVRADYCDMTLSSLLNLNVYMVIISDTEICSHQRVPFICCWFGHKFKQKL